MSKAKLNLCANCGFHFANKRTMSQHKCGKSSFECPYRAQNGCFKTFRHQKKLEAHLWKIHVSEIGPGICSLCCKSVSAVRDHVRSHHLGIVDAKKRCHFCLKRVPNLSLHLGAKKAANKCHLCNVTVGKKSCLDRHIRRMHDNTRSNEGGDTSDATKLVNDCDVSHETSDVYMHMSDALILTCDAAKSTSDATENTSDTIKTTSDNCKKTSDAAKITSVTAKKTSDYAMKTSDTAKKASDTSMKTSDTVKSTSDTDINSRNSIKITSVNCDNDDEINDNHTSDMSDDCDIVSNAQNGSDKESYTNTSDISDISLQKGLGARILSAGLCPYCDTTLGNLFNHLRHPQLKCDRCDAIVMTHSCLRTHKEKVHDNPLGPNVTCHKCHIDFASDASFKAHNNSAHPMLNMNCPYCTKKVKNLSKHLKLSRTSEEYFKCDRCDMKTLNHICLKNHQRLVHQKKSCVQCCQIDFASIKHKQSHVAIFHHHEKKPSKCCGCDMILDKWGPKFCSKCLFKYGCIIIVKPVKKQG